MYSQNREEEVILDYFKDQIGGKLLDIGANDGITLSNSRALIEQGWRADLVEPSPKAFTKLKILYDGNTDVDLHEIAVGEDKEVILYESSTHLNRGDIGLLSTTVRGEMERWTKEEFTPVKVKSLPFAAFLDVSTLKQFDFINIDAEGQDWGILQQMDLTALGCKLLCIEWNGNKSLQQSYFIYCREHGLYPIHTNSENIIYAKNK